MPTDIPFHRKGPIALCDLGALGSRPPSGDVLVGDRAYVDIAREGRLFFFEAQDVVVDVVRLFVDEHLPADLALRVTKEVRGLLLRVPTGAITASTMYGLADDATDDAREASLTLTIGPGDYRLDAYVIEPTAEELAGPKVEGSAGRLQTLVIVAAVWFAFCTLCYAILAFGRGLARDALGIYAGVGLLPLLAAIVLYYATGARRRVGTAARVYEALEKTPSLVVTLSPRAADDDLAVGGGLSE